tara:strand:+ start:21 stop:500 length:480 start_codon:yes stop_codon:yes gene_type:complete
MKTIIYFISATSIAIALSACGGVEADAAGHAKEMCECLQDAGLDNSISISKIQDRSFQRNLERKMEKTVPKCLLPIVKEMEEEISDLSKNDKKEYTKAFLKACIDTECADIALDLIPYDLLGLGLGEAERQINGQRRYRNEYDDSEDVLNDEYDDYDDY